MPIRARIAGAAAASHVRAVHFLDRGGAIVVLPKDVGKTVMVEVAGPMVCQVGSDCRHCRRRPQWPGTDGRWLLGWSKWRGISSNRRPSSDERHSDKAVARRKVHMAALPIRVIVGIFLALTLGYSPVFAQLGPASDTETPAPAATGNQTSPAAPSLLPARSYIALLFGGARIGHA